MKDHKTALLIDANALIHRSWHAIRPLTSPDGRLVNAAYGFTTSLLKVLSDLKPTHVAVCWDTPEPTFRHVAEPAYKAQRVEQPQEFYDQVPMVKDIVSALGIRNVEKPGYEADDLLGTLAVLLASKGVEVTILTSDRDAWQLISPRISVLAFKKGVTETMRYDEKALFETTGLHADQIPDYKALRGDASDNLKGVPGIGEKTATILLQAYKDLDGVFKAAHSPKSDLSDSVRNKLVEGEKSGRATLPLVRVITDAPIKLTESDLVRQDMDKDGLKQILTGLGFKTMVERLFGSKEKAKDEPKEQAAEKPTQPAKKFHAKPASSVKEMEPVAFLKALRSGDELVVHVVEAAQGSLFQDGPLFVLRSSDAICQITRKSVETAATNKLLSSVLSDTSIKKIGHDLKRTWHVCHKLELALNGSALDTQIAAYLLSSGEGRYELDALTVSLLGRSLAEGDARPLDEASAIWDLAVIYKKELSQENLMSVLERFELPLIPVLGEMEEAGILIDRPYFKSLAEEFRAERIRLEEEMVKLAGEPFNPASPAQLSHVLFEKLQIPSKGLKRGKTGISTAAAELEKIEGLHPIVSKISEYREVAKLLSTYIETLPQLADANGRVHTTYNITVAATGRLSSIDPNLQNIPVRTELGRRIRKGFVAAKGMTLLSCDYSQIELRIIAALAKDKKMLDAFNRNADIHTETAAAIWHVKPEEVTKDQRRAAKAINFGIIYGQGPQGLAKAAGVPFAEAKAFIEEYFAVYSGIDEYLENTRALAHAQGFVETLFGRRRPIPEINSPLPQMRAAAERMAINMPVQGTAADIMKLGLIEVAKHLPTVSAKSKILLQVHDELVLEVPEKEVAMVAAAVTDLMANVTKIGCPIVVEAHAGKNWEDMKSL